MLSELNEAVRMCRGLLIAQGIVNNGIKKSSLQRVMEMQQETMAA